MHVVLGASPNINLVMAIFSPQPLKKWIFPSNWPPPPQEESKCKNVQFLQWILKDDDVYFKKNHSILNLR